MYQNILLPVDGSEHSIHALEHAIALAQSQPDCQVTVLHVAPFSFSYTEAGFAAATLNLDLQAIERENGNKLLKQYGEKLQAAGVNHELLLKEGFPAKEICESVAHGHYDLVVVGSRGLGAFGKYVLGSVSHKLLHHAKSPVLVVR